MFCEHQSLGIKLTQATHGNNTVFLTAVPEAKHLLNPEPLCKANIQKEGEGKAFMDWQSQMRPDQMSRWRKPGRDLLGSNFFIVFGFQVK